MIPLVVLGLTNLASLAALALLIVNSRRERDTMLRAVNLSITEGTKERESARKERQEILNRKAQGDKAVIYDAPDEPQAITFDSDPEYWATKENGNQ